MGAAQLVARTGIVHVRAADAPSHNDKESLRKVLVRRGGAREARVGHDFFGLRPVAFAVRASQEEPLVTIERAEHRVWKCVFPQLGVCSGDEIGRAFASRFEFTQQLTVRPSAGRHQAIRTLHASAAIYNHLPETIVAEGGRGRTGRLLQRVIDVVQNQGFDDHDVLETFGHGPAIRGGLVLQLSGREISGGAEQILTSLR